MKSNEFAREKYTIISNFVILNTDMKARMDNQRNKQLILDATYKYYSVAHVLPSQKMLSKMTGLSTRTIRRHKDDLLGADFFQERKWLYMTMMDQVVMALVLSAIKGNMTAIKYYFHWVFGYDFSKPARLS